MRRNAAVRLPRLLLPWLQQTPFSSVDKSNTVPKLANIYHPPDVMDTPILNHGLAFTDEQRYQYGIAGLLPPAVEGKATLLKRCQQQLARIQTPLGKYEYLTRLRQMDSSLYYSVVLDDLEGILPIIYTPTVGEACQEFSHVYFRPSGLYINLNHRGHICKILDNWYTPVEMIVVTDGSRILGLGDLGCNGMGISIGKLSLYSAGSGVHPGRTCPIVLDVGTNNQQALDDPTYIGLRQKRCSDEEYYAFVEEFVLAVKHKWPHCVLQFEDFSNNHCFEILKRFRHRFRCFNDDIQGTGAVIAAGFLNAVRLSGQEMSSQRIVMYGAGSAAVGVADQIVTMMIAHGVDKETATKSIYLVDTKGLVTNTRGDKLAPHKLKFCRLDVPSNENVKSLGEVIDAVKPTALLGLAGAGPAFTESMLRSMQKHTKRPIVFPLSNPTSEAECNAEQAVKWTDGNVIFASGSPFDPVVHNGRTYRVAQGNNMYIFPGLGFGCILAQPREIPDELIQVASTSLAGQCTEDMLAKGMLYPSLSEIRNISAIIARDVMLAAKEMKLNETDYTSDRDELLRFVKESMWSPYNA